MSDRILVTSALPYVNGIKHLGNLAGSILPADVYARFQRLRGRDVLFVCGTDEHGTPAELAAQQAGLPVADYCARQHAAQADIYRRLHISFDHFGRSSSLANHALTQQLFLRLEANGFIEERVLRQLWSRADDRFLPDRYVVGTCPHCGDPSARGDQCDSCGTLLDPAELITPRSALSGSTALEARATRHLFLLQSKLTDHLRRWLDTKTDWDPLVLSLARGLLDQGLQDRCITRDLAWGVPVPKPGWDGKVFYVWFDAPIAYAALTQEWAAAAPGRDWRDWWRTGSGTRTRAVSRQGQRRIPRADISRDDHRIRCRYPPGGPHQGVFLADLGRGKILHQSWPRHLSRQRARRTATRPVALVADGERPGGLRHAVHTCPVRDGLQCGPGRRSRQPHASRAVVVATRFDGRVPEQGEPGEAEARLALEADAIITVCAEHFEAIRLRRTCESLRALWSLCDRYFAAEAPWATIGTDEDRAACIVRTATNLLRLAAVIASPSCRTPMSGSRGRWAARLRIRGRQALPSGCAHRAVRLAVYRICCFHVCRRNGLRMSRRATAHEK